MSNLMESLMAQRGRAAKALKEQSDYLAACGDCKTTGDIELALLRAGMSQIEADELCHRFIRRGPIGILKTRVKKIQRQLAKLDKRIAGLARWHATQAGGS